MFPVEFWHLTETVEFLAALYHKLMSCLQLGAHVETIDQFIFQISIFNPESFIFSSDFIIFGLACFHIISTLFLRFFEAIELLIEVVDLLLEDFSQLQLWVYRWSLCIRLLHLIFVFYFHISSVFWFEHRQHIVGNYLGRQFWRNIIFIDFLLKFEKCWIWGHIWCILRFELSGVVLGSFWSVLQLAGSRMRRGFDSCWWYFWLWTHWHWKLILTQIASCAADSCIPLFLKTQVDLIFLIFDRIYHIFQPQSWCGLILSYPGWKCLLRELLGWCGVSLVQIKQILVLSALNRNKSTLDPCMCLQNRISAFSNSSSSSIFNIQIIEWSMNSWVHVPRPRLRLRLDRDHLQQLPWMPRHLALLHRGHLIPGCECNGGMVEGFLDERVHFQCL